MYTTKSALPQGQQVQKAALMREAENLFTRSGIPFRAGRMARLIGQQLKRGSTAGAWNLIRVEIDIETRKIATPRLRNAQGVIDPTGQLAAARADAERDSRRQKYAPASGCHQSEGEVNEMRNPQ